jgi:urea ABC transporter permease protein UrtB
MESETLLIFLLEIFNSISVLILIALGLSVIYGMMGVINLAHAEFMMLGGYSVLVATRLGLSIWLGIAIAPVIVAIIGAVIERGIIRFLYGRPLDSMLATWGLSLVLIQSVTIIFGPTTEGLPTPMGNVSVAAYKFSAYRFFVIGITVAILLAIYLLFKHTRFGIRVRATMQIPSIASACGLNTQLIYMSSFALGSALAGAAGAIMSPLIGLVPTMGAVFIGRAFVTVIVGGPVILLGTTVSGSILGIIETTVSFLSTPFMGQAALLGFAIFIIRVLPKGISAFWQ